MIKLENALATIAFPSISTGAYRFPIERAAGIAVQTVREFTEENPGIEEVIFVLFSAPDLAIYELILKG